jgi:hypothetical protein
MQTIMTADNRNPKRRKFAPNNRTLVISVTPLSNGNLADTYAVGLEFGRFPVPDIGPHSYVFSVSELGRKQRGWRSILTPVANTGLLGKGRSATWLLLEKCGSQDVAQHASETERRVLGE